MVPITTLPLLMRFGFTRTVRFIPVFFSIGFLILVMGVGDNDILNLVNSVIGDSLWLQIALVLAVLAIASALFVASAALSTRFYRNLEF